MNKVLEVKNKIKEITDKNQISTIFKDKKTSVDLLIDYKSGEYSGLRISKELEGESIEIDTKYSWIINNDKPSDWVELDQNSKNAIDAYAISHFDYDDIDEDDFKNLNKYLEKDLSNEYKENSKKILKKIKSELEIIRDGNYPNDLIKLFTNKFEKIKKNNGYNLKYIDDSIYIKINTKKENIKVKNNYSYEKKIDINNLVKGFDISKIEEYLEQKRKKKEYNDKMMDFDDSFDMSSIHVSRSTMSSDKRDIDLDRKERTKNKK
ncbi:hypothetical protein HV819_05270 [Anaerococcus sp. AGMB00486]|uniref:Large polyvalent protein associated domain-containing protein n=2 Tax=Anaerococcus TaxID=165779 RepID=A0ABX2N9N9_9FIRM|nr:MULTISPECIES: hypothetical protein [Anaerococcus]MDY3006827.1 hypothetical protein [Anaerococcus porci]MSS78282.1 hypothetical protein [Anaerococcus porci]NVF11396.1 hypothetical protein [Anaerococcus faecalis]